MKQEQQNIVGASWVRCTGNHHIILFSLYICEILHNKRIHTNTGDLVAQKSCINKNKI